jgi:hypothetical protein
MNSDRPEIKDAIVHFASDYFTVVLKRTSTSHPIMHDALTPDASERDPAAHRRTGELRRAVMNRTLTLAVAGLVATTAFANAASARGVYRMVSVDHTQGGPPVIHDNGVPDGRICKIFFRTVFDPWIEDFRVVKAKKCI